MRPDTGSLRMRYEAAWDHMIAVWDRVRRQPPEDIPAALQELYRRGYQRGRIDGMNFEEALFTSAPAELEWQFAAAWELGYEHGKLWGGESRRALLQVLLKDAGFEPE
jgi:hypothetical protein